MPPIMSLSRACGNRIAISENAKHVQRTAEQRNHNHIARSVWSAPACPAPYTHLWRSERKQESQTDSGPKPRVARNELTWAIAPSPVPTLKGLWRCSIPSAETLGPQPFQGWLYARDPHPG